jgi:hypothetical protein
MLVLGAGMALAVAAPATASAAPQWACTATPLTASLLAAELPLDLLRSNPSEVPCVDDQATILDIPPIVGLSATVLDSDTDATPAVIPDRTVTAHAEVADLGLSPVGFPGLLTVGVAEATATASCPTAGGGPVLAATSRFDDVRVLGLRVDVLNDPVDIDVGLVRARIVPNVEQRTSTSVRRVALHVEITALLGGAEVLVADIAEASVAAVDLPCEASTAGEPPTVTVPPGSGNRELTAQATPASAAAHDVVTECTISARPQGSSGPFVPVATTFDEQTGTCTAKLDAATFPGPDEYEVQSTAVDADGDEGTSAPATVAVLAPAVDPPTASGRELSADVTPVPAVAIDSCEFSLTPAGGGAARTVNGTYDATTQTCSVTVPSDVADGSYDVEVTVLDVNGDSGTAVSSEPLDVTGHAPTVELEPGQPNREILATGTAPAGETLDSCTIEVRPAGGGAFETVASTLDPETGECSAKLASGTYPPGEYDVRVTVVDSSGDEGETTGTLIVARPSVGEPVLRDGTIEVPVTRAPGTPIASCRITITPVGGGVPVVVDGVVSGGVCRAALPPGVTPGAKRIDVEVTDANGDTGTGSGAITVPTGGPKGPGGGGSPGEGGSGGGGTSSPFPDGTPRDLALACTDRRLVLTDVVRRGRRVRIAGAAEDRYRGRRVALVFTRTGKVVARPRVGSDGLLRATVRAPRKALAKSNRARYMLRAGKERSLPLKLQRRMARVSATRSGATVTVRGTVTRPLARSRQRVVLRRMVSCGRYEVVGRTRLSRTGRYRFRVPAPTDARTAIYRAETRVPSRPGGPARSRTFTLPRAIALR